MLKLKGETAAVTGSTSGIGKKTAELLLQEGCKVAICSRNAAKVNETLSEFKKLYGDYVIGIPCDVSSFAAVKDLVAKTVAAFGSLRIFIANAGVSPIYGPFEYFSDEQIVSMAKKIIDINLIGTINSVGAVLPQMKKQKYGRIITLSGGGADRPVRNFSIYGASKGGILAFSRSVALELKAAGSDITLNIFQPGPMKTDLNKKLNLVNGWRDEETFHRQWENLFNSVNLDINECVRSLIPYIMSGCRTNGKQFLGFSLFKMLPKLFRVRKILKSL